MSDVMRIREAAELARFGRFSYFTSTESIMNGNALEQIVEAHLRYQEKPVFI